MRVTMVQVAREAGVDKATVSRALKGDPRISLATREKVWEAVKRLGYEPDAVAKGLSSSKSGMVAVVFRTLAPGWTGSFLSGVERVLAKGRTDFMVRSTGGVPCTWDSLLRTLTARRIDGLLCLDPQLRKNPGIPVVTVGFRLEGACSVLIDTEEGIRQLRAISRGAPVVYRRGAEALFPEMEERLEEGETQAGEQDEWVFCDGVDPAPGERAVVSWGRGTDCGHGGPFRLVWPAFETGVLAARLLLNALKGQGALPDVVLVQPRVQGKDPRGGCEEIV